MWLIEKFKQICITKKEHKHEMEFEKGFGYRCKHCGKPKSRCKDGR